MLTNLLRRSLCLLTFLPLPALAQTTRPIVHPFSFSGMLQKVDGPNLIVLPGLDSSLDALTPDSLPPEIVPVSLPTDTIPTEIHANGKRSTLADLQPGMRVNIFVRSHAQAPTSVIVNAFSPALTGTITRIAGPLITLRPSRPNAPEITVTTTPNIVVLSRAAKINDLTAPLHPATLADLTPGTQVLVTSPNGPAQQIVITPPKAATPPAP